MKEITLCNLGWSHLINWNALKRRLVKSWTIKVILVNAQREIKSRAEKAVVLENIHAIMNTMFLEM